jgi:hypothetical protein
MRAAPTGADEDAGVPEQVRRHRSLATPRRPAARSDWSARRDRRLPWRRRHANARRDGSARADDRPRASRLLNGDDRDDRSPGGHDDGLAVVDHADRVDSRRWVHARPRLDPPGKRPRKRSPGREAGARAGPTGRWRARHGAFLRPATGLLRRVQRRLPVERRRGRARRASPDRGLWRYVRSPRHAVSRGVGAVGTGSHSWCPEETCWLERQRRRRLCNRRQTAVCSLAAAFPDHFYVLLTKVSDRLIRNG